MKKLLALFLTLALVLTATGCTGDKAVSSEAAVHDNVTVRIAGLKGPTSMGMVKLMNDSDLSSTVNKYEFTIAGSADEITPKLIKGELDIAAVPANLASVLYNKTSGKIKLLAINTLGVIYIVEKGNTVTDIKSLKGKTILATGKGSTPEYALRYILKENGIDADKDVTIEWKSEPTEVVAALKGADGGVAMLPQPYVTVAEGAVEGLRVAVDLNDSWKQLDNGSLFLTGVLAVRSDFVTEHPNAINDFLTEYKASTEYTNSDVEGAAALVEKYDIVKAAVAKKAIPKCNITYIAGNEMKTAASGYLKVLADQNVQSVGGTLPGDDFYYVK